jgi:hypothetical protein
MKLSTIIGLALSLGTAIPSTVSARIGETLDQCQLRYGVMVRFETGKRQDYPQYCFQKGSVEIRVRLYNGFSAQETFLPLQGKLTAGQIAEIQKSNSQGATGKEVIQEVRKNRAAHSNVVVITTTEFQRVFQKNRGTGF